MASDDVCRCRIEACDKGMRRVVCERCAAILADAPPAPGVAANVEVPRETLENAANLMEDASLMSPCGANCDCCSTIIAERKLCLVALRALLDPAGGTP